MTELIDTLILIGAFAVGVVGGRIFGTYILVSFNKIPQPKSLRGWIF